MELFDRRVAVTIGDVRVKDLRVSFNVVNSIDRDANSATVEISNLSDSTRGSILEQGEGRPQLIIEAGYKDVFGEIYKGRALEVSSTRGRTGWTLNIAAKDGLKELNKVVNVSLGPKTSVDQLVTKIAQQMGLKFTRAIARIQKQDIGATIKEFAEGIVSYGRGMDELDKAANKLGVEWSIQGEELEMRLPDETLPGSSYSITDATGLIGSPELSFDEENPNKVFIEFTTMLISELRPLALVELESREFGGSYKITRADHVGDTHGDTWTTHVTSRAI